MRFMYTDKVTEGHISGEIKRPLSLPIRRIFSSTACILPYQAQMGATFNFDELTVSEKVQYILDNQELERFHLEGMHNLDN